MNVPHLKSMGRLILFLIILSLTSRAQEPPGYYNTASGLTGQELRTVLFLIIKDHNEQTYASLWEHFLLTDQKDNGYVWDMYSDIPGGSPAYNYTFITDQCGNYGAEGDCYNREHSFPKSWFDDQLPMLTDLFHIYPTDGYVNGKRSNYPYGEVNSHTWISTNTSKLGNNTFPGYNGTVFEPIDEYKGDFARTYFYMMTRYMDLVSQWESDMLSGGDLSSWARSMLMEWHEDDPVSAKETNRNNAIYDIQDNRNPFIDHPEWVDEIWGVPASMYSPAMENISLRSDGHSICVETKGAGTEGILNIFNAQGQLISSYFIEDEQECIRLNLHSGLYLGQFTHAQGASTLKFYLISR